MSDHPAGEAQALSLPDGAEPALAADTFVAPGATVVGRVTTAERSSVWYGAVLRADLDGQEIRLGARSNIQDNVSVHVEVGQSARIGEGVSVGHNAVVHAAEIEDDVLIGMGAVVLTGARVGSGSIVAAGTVVLEGTEIPPRSLVAGVPGKVRRQTTDDEVESIRRNAEVYLELSAAHAEARGA